MNTDQKIGKVLGELESEIMRIIWQSNSSVSVRDVTKKLRKNRKIAYTTVMTVMGRLSDKGLLKRIASGRAYIYKSAYSKDRFLTRVSRQIIRNLMANFGESAIAHFAQEVEKLAPQKRQQLRKILKEARG